MPGQVKVGTQFRSGYADANPLWEVKSARGRGSWNCEIINEKIVIDGKEYDDDYAGTKKVFGTEEITRALRMGALFNKFHQQHADFYSSLRPGQIVHHVNHEGSYVRCKVVKKDGQNVLQPIALVGDWPKHELPHRYADGGVYNGYYVDKIIKNETYSPNESQILESPTASWGKRVNKEEVARLPAINYELPAPTKEEQDTAAAWAWKKEVQAELEKVVDQKTLAAFKAFLKPLLEG
jgi:hypothetical protein